MADPSRRSLSAIICRRWVLWWSHPRPEE